MSTFQKVLRKILIFAASAAAAAVFILTAVLVFIWLDKPLVRKILVGQLERKTEASIKIGKLDYAFFPPGIRLCRTAVAIHKEWGDIELAAEDIRADSDWRLLIKGVNPALGGIHIRQADIRIRLARSEEHAAGLDTLPDLFKALNRVGEIDLGDVKADISLPGLRAILDIQSLKLSNRGANGFRISLRTKDFRAGTPDRGDLWAGPFQAAVDLGYDGDLRWRGGIEFASSRLSLFGRVAEFPPVDLRTEGSFSLHDGSLSISPFDLRCRGLFKASGKIKMKPGPPAFQSIEGEGEIENTLWFLTKLKAELPGLLQAVDVTANPSVQGDVAWETKSGEPPRFEAKLKIGGLRLSSRFQNSRVDVSASGSAAFMGLPPDIRYWGEIRAFLDKWEEGGLKLRGIEARLPVEGHFLSWTASPATLTMKKVILPAGRSEMTFEGLVVRAGRLAGDSQTLTLDNVDMDLPGLVALRGGGRCAFGPKPYLQLSFKSSKADLSLIRSRLSFLLPESVAGWTMGGQTEGEFQVKHAGGREPWLFTGSVDLSGANFQNPTSSVVFEGLAASFAFDGRYDQNAESVRTKGLIKVARGESLFRDLYIDWSRNPFILEFDLDWPRLLNKIELNSTKAGLASIGALDAQGTVYFSDSTASHLKINAAFDLGRLSAWISSLRNMTPAQKIEGSADGHVDITLAQKTALIAGRWNIHKGKFEDPASGFSLGNVEAGLPFCVGNGVSAAAEEAPGVGLGFLEAAELRTSWLTISPFRLDFSTGKNSFLIRPFRFALFGGMIDIGETAVNLEAGGKGFKGLSALSVEGIDLMRLPLSKTSTQIKGSFKAGFPRIELTPEKITFEGEANVKAFGGTAKINRILVVNPFLSGRSFRCDAVFEAIDLEQLTDVVPFGRVTGILRGEIKDLAVSYGQPESFSLRLESVRRKGVSQKFSLRAVDSLSVISSGEKAAPGPSRWWLRFVSHFRYSKIGIASTLRNDLFTLRGTIVKGGVEYLVKKAQFFGIDVVNRMPNNTISFKDMSLRLKRVGESQAADDEGRPF